MKAWNSLRAAAAILLYWSVLLFFGAEDSLQRLVPVCILCASACGIAGLLEKSPCRFLCALIPAGCFFLCHSGKELGMMLLPALYSEMLICTSQIRTDAWNYASAARFMLPMFAVLAFLSGAFEIRTMPILFSAMTGFLCTVFFLRRLRFEKPFGRVGSVHELLTVLSVPVAAAAVILAVLLLKYPLILIVKLLGAVFGLLLNLAILLIPTGYFSQNREFEETAGHKSTMPTEIAEELTQPTETEAFLDVPMPHVSITVLQVIVSVLLLAFGLWLLYRLSRRKAQKSETEDWESEDSEVTDAAETPEQLKSNRLRIRRIYADYIRLVIGSGYYPGRGDTSLDIDSVVSPYTGTPASRALREIYICARYHTDRPVTAEDVRRAKRLYREIKNNPQIQKAETAR